MLRCFVAIIMMRHMHAIGRQGVHLYAYLLPVGLQGTAAVAAVLASNHSIYTLSFAGCPMRDEGAMALAEALKTNISLYKLDLSNCTVSARAQCNWHTDASVPSILLVFLGLQVDNGPNSGSVWWRPAARFQSNTRQVL